MVKYSKYLFMNIISKKGFWITLLLCVGVILTAGLFSIKNSNSAGNSYVSEISTYSKFIPFVLSTLITCLYIIYIFKHGEQDGTELLIASKPLKRNQIIIGKFIVLILWLLFWQVLLFAITISYTQYDDSALPIERLKFSASISVGGFIVQLILSSFFTFLSKWFSNIAIIIFGTLGATIIPITSMIIAPLSGGQATNVSRLGVTWNKVTDSSIVTKVTNQVELLYDNIDKETDPVKKRELINQLQNADIDTMKTMDDIRITRPTYDEKNIATREAYFRDRWYEKIESFDLWYQWSGFYEIIMGKENISPSSIVKWSIDDYFPNLDKKFSVDPTSTGKLSQAFIIVDQSGPQKNKDLVDVYPVFQSIFDTTLNGSNQPTYPIYTYSWNATKKSYDETIFKKTYMNKDGNLVQTNPRILDLFKDATITFEERMRSIVSLRTEDLNAINPNDYINYNLVVKKLKEDKTYVEPNEITISEKILKGSSDVDQQKWVKDNISSHYWLFENGDKIEVWRPYPFIHTSTKVYIWTSIAIFMLIMTIAIYFRRDFK